jgi:hypothetical protein
MAHHAGAIEHLGVSEVDGGVGVAEQLIVECGG